MRDLKAERAEEWRSELRKNIKAKDRTDIERVRMPEMNPVERAKYMDKEVNVGLSAEMAVREASRCMDCASPTCIDGCPVGINIPKFVKYIETQDFLSAAATLKETSALPAVCGRVCPQEKQCEANCFYVKKMDKEPVAIGYLERFAADFERNTGKAALPTCVPSNGIKVASVGSGPAALAWAGDMIKLGYDVTVFEALHEVGGVLKYGIPEFRLPNAIVDFELDNLKRMGVKFELNFIVGRTTSFDDLRTEGYQAFFVSSGAGLPRFMNIPGENSNGVMSANEYLTRVNLMSAGRAAVDTPVLKGKNVAIIGGGNTAMDSVRTAKRMGAERAMIVYRRSMDEMPARLEEIHHAQEEGVEFLNLSNPVSYSSNESGRVCSMRLQKMELGEPDASGRRSPVVVEGAEYDVPVDMVIVAVGVSPNPLVPQELPELNVTKWGTIVVNEENMQSSLPWVFAGGDIVRGGATVILAMGDGRRAAEGMHKYLRSKL
ncbi:MAG: NADPH-dependent glutamate synthase [Mangrovibacterium sp.]